MSEEQKDKKVGIVKIYKSFLPGTILEFVINKVDKLNITKTKTTGKPFKALVLTGELPKQAATKDIAISPYKVTINEDSDCYRNFMEELDGESLSSLINKNVIVTAGGYKRFPDKSVSQFFNKVTMRDSKPSDTKEVINNEDF